MGGLNVYAYPANPLTGVDLDGLARHEPRRNRNKKPKPKKNARPAQTDAEGVDPPARRSDSGDQPAPRTGPAPDTVRVQRVEARDSRMHGKDTNRRIAHNPETGQVTILPARKKRDKALHVSFDNPDRMKEFQDKRDSQRPGDCVTRSFDVPRSEVDRITAGSVPQGPGTSAKPGRPLEVDQPHEGQFALHPDDADRLAAAAIPGSFTEE
jgi:hypothetical protein